MMRAIFFLVLTVMMVVGFDSGFAQEKPARKSYAAAVAISFFVPGGGTLYAGKKTRGGVELGITALSFGLMAAAGPDESWQGLAGVTLFMSNWVVSIVDAPIAVWQYNREHRKTALITPDNLPALTPPLRNYYIPLLALRF